MDSGTDFLITGLIIILAIILGYYTIIYHSLFLTNPTSHLKHSLKDKTSDFLNYKVFFDQ